MKIIKYNKLIRDKIPAIIKRDRGIPEISHLDHKRFIKELKRKLIEEAAELQNARGSQEVLNELSDVLEILQSIARVEKIKWSKVENKRVMKNKARGGFKKKIFLKAVRMPD